MSLVSTFVHRGLLDEIRRGLVSDSPTVRDASDMREVVLALIYSVSMWTTVVFVSVWSYRTNVNTRLLFSEWMVFPPRWTIAWYFIPIAWYWKPFQAMKELWRKSTASGPDRPTSEWLLAVWWAGWIGFQLTQDWGVRVYLRGKGIDNEIAAQTFDMVSDVMFVVASCSLAAIVRRIQERHDARQAVLEETGTMNLGEEPWN